jgi:hypothetical protein
MKYGYILVTADGAMLRNREALPDLGLRVMTDAEAVALVERAIVDRDAAARRDAAESGQPHAGVGCRLVRSPPTITRT